MFLLKGSKLAVMFTQYCLKNFAFLSLQEPNREKLEKALNAGQLEEVIKQAEGELTLARKMLDWKPWEPLVQEPPEGQWKWPI